MSEPTQGPYVAVQLGELWEVCNRENTIICTVWELGGAEHTAHLLASSWAMREALQAVHDWRGLCDADDLETFERIGEMFQRDTGYLRPGKDDPRLIGEGAEAERDRKWNEWITKKNGEINARIRAALAASRGEAKS